MKRCAFQIMVLLILRAIVNVGVAWGLVAYSFNRARMSQRAGENVWEDHDAAFRAFYSQKSGFATVGILLFRAGEESRTSIEWFKTWSGRIEIEQMPKWSLPRQKHRWHEYERAVRLLDLAGGWPSESLCSTVVHDLGMAGEFIRIECGVSAPLIGRNVGNPWIPGCVLPLNPIWPGFAINTIFYAAILWMVFLVPGMMRRRIRRRRGQCPACAYPVGSSPVCTECGAALQTQKAETQKAESP